MEETSIIRKRRAPRIYFGWWMVIFSGIMTGLGSGFYNLGISALFKPIASELGLSRGATSLATGIGRLQGGIEAPLTGWLSDRYGPRWVIITGFCFVITGLILMNFITMPWHYYVVWGVMVGIGINLALTIAFDKALTNWFITKSGLAFGIRFAAIGIFSAIVVPIVAWIVVEEGWRTTCLIWAGVMCTGIPLSLYFIKKGRPEYYGLLPDGVTSAEATETDQDTAFNKGVQYADSFQRQGFTLRQAMRTRAYWLIVLAWACYTLVFGAFNIHCIPFLTDMGIAPTVAGGMMAMMVFLTVPGRFMVGFLADRVKKDRLQFIAAVAFLFQAIGIIVFLIKQTEAMAYLLLILYGLSSGAPTPFRLTMAERYFGRKAFASIVGTTMFLNAPLSFLAPIYTGWIYDTTGSYIIAFTIFAGLLTLAAVFSCFIRPPKPPEQTTDARSFI